jgi:alkylation response protein AidB-like acyl-CoA dehydrogenase
LPLIDSRNHARCVCTKYASGLQALLGAAGSALPALTSVLDRGRVCLAAEMLGMAEKLFEMTLDYLKTRVQFDVAIGSFQSLQHRAAQLYVELALARSAVMAGLDALDDMQSMTRVERQRLASLAKWKAGADGTSSVVNEAVQMHGGIGVTDELDVGLFLKRIRVAQACLGDADFHCERYAALELRARLSQR